MPSRGDLRGPSRFAGRARVVGRALLLRRRARVMPADPRRILVAHHLLLGDTLMLTPLLKKLRTLHPAADIAMTVPKAIAPLYATRPYGVRALPFDPRDALRHLYREPPFDVAFVPGDNRYAWLAAAMRTRWIVAFDGDRPATKSWPVDDLVAYPGRPGAWGDLVAQLIAGAPAAPFRASEWRAPPHADFPRSFRHGLSDHSVETDDREQERDATEQPDHGKAESLRGK
jgi:hypothetical protein